MYRSYSTGPDLLKAQRLLRRRGAGSGSRVSGPLTQMRARGGSAGAPSAVSKGAWCGCRLRRRARQQFHAAPLCRGHDGAVRSQCCGAAASRRTANSFYKRVGFRSANGLDMLFVTSGFLVTASLVVRQDLIAYLWARILRVYPGMWVMLVLTVFVLAPALTSLPRDDYYTSP